MAVLSLSVSELKCACLDAGWRRRWLEGERPSTRHFAPPGIAPVGGAAFHALAETFLAWLAGSAQESRTLASEEQLWGQLYRHFAERELDRLLGAEKVDTALYLSAALQAFCGRLSQLRQQSRQFTGWTDLILTQEQRIRDVRLPVGGSTVFLSGTVDALRLHPRQGLEIVDYKLSRGANLRHDLLQIAIYARMVRLSEAGLAFRGCLEYYLPALEVLEISAGELNELFDDLVAPVLQELAGGRPPPARAPQPNPAPAAGSLAAHPGMAGLDATAGKILACFQAFKLPVEIMGRQEAPQIVRYLVRPVPGVRVVSLANRVEDLQVALGLDQTPRIEPVAGGVAIDIPKASPDLVLWREVVPRCGEGTFAIPLGVGIDNELLVARLDEPGTCHGLIAGASGSGKSEWLKSAVATLMSRNRPATLRLTLIDPKLLTFAALEGAAHLSGPILTDLGGALRCLAQAEAEMQRRYHVLARERHNDLGERHRAGKTDLAYQVIVFDEFADLILAGREEKKHFESSVARLAAKGRACGIHLILATQRPDKHIVTGLIKANLPLKVCLRVTSAVNSQIVLGESGAEKLLGQGDLLCDAGRGIVRAQAPFVTSEDWRQI